MICPPLFDDDLDHILAHTGDLWEDLRGTRVFLTGGTGFFGAWLVESFLWANDKLALGSELMVLSRNPQRFLDRLPHLSGRAGLSFCTGDVRTFPFPAGKFSHLIHAATDAGTSMAKDDPLGTPDTIVNGTRHTLDFAVRCGATRVLLTSSGAIYGPQPPDTTHISEDYLGAPDIWDIHSAYGQGKRFAEHLGGQYAKRYGFDCVIARCFAFVGPHLPLDAHFAIGNFIADALAARPILIKGDGSVVRSYLYAADLAIWLWRALTRGLSRRAYNVGSDIAVTMMELAAAIRSISDNAENGDGRLSFGRESGASIYVPNIYRATVELDVQVWIDLRNAIARTINWHSANRSPSKLKKTIDPHELSSLRSTDSFTSLW